MKIVPIILSLVVLGLGAGGVYYSMQQATTLSMLTRVRTANSEGLDAVNNALDQDVANAVSARKKAIEASQNEHNSMVHARNERQESQIALDATTAENERLKKALEDAKRRAAEQKDEMDATIAALRALPAFGSDGDPQAAAERLADHMKQEMSRKEELTATRDEKILVRESATDKVGKENTELARLNGINQEFVEDYIRNADEFVIQSVDPRWHFVVFNAGRNSGIVVGDSTPLMVKRGNNFIVSLRITKVDPNGTVTAEYDEEELPAGVRLEIGDKVFRQKPLGA